jgi:excinuclease ABC subunit A
MVVAPGLRIEGARQNNLKNITLEIPHDHLTVVTGVSGSGKSSLAFDTIFAEGQWRYVESLSTYARMFLDRVDRPDVDRIERIRPAVALEQKNPVRTARSTVGTATEIADYLRLLYAKIGRLHCPRCGSPASAHSAESIVPTLLAAHQGARALIAFRLPVPAGTSPAELWASLARRGFARVRVNGEIIDLAAPPGRLEALDIAVILDRVVIDERIQSRLAESIATALREGGGSVEVDIVGGRPLVFGEGLRCERCAVDLERPQPLLFSFNHPLGACPECKGFGNLLRPVTRRRRRGTVDACFRSLVPARTAQGRAATRSRPRPALPRPDGRSAHACL